MTKSSTARPVCTGCGHDITSMESFFRDALGCVWHVLCWQAEANKFYEAETLDDCDDQC